jgi:tetratricopeptide (TPR) repeat protein
VSEEDRLNLGFLQRLMTPNDEEALVDGCRELLRANNDGALEHLRNAVHLADGAFMAGFLALKKGLFDEAARWLEFARRNQSSLGRIFKKYGIAATFAVSITPEVTAHIGPNLRGALLGLAEAYQLQERHNEALACLHALLRLEPHDIVVKLSLAELLFDARPADRQVCHKVVRLGEGIVNESALHAALLLYKGKALSRLGLMEAAEATFTDALRRKADRPDELLRALRYERALVYEALGRHRRVRSELEKLYADAPDYEDVAARLGLGSNQV